MGEFGALCVQGGVSFRCLVFWWQMLVQKSFHLALRHGTLKAIDGFALHHQNTGGNAANAKGCGNFLFLVRIHLSQDKAASIVGFQLF